MCVNFYDHLYTIITILQGKLTFLGTNLIKFPPYKLINSMLKGSYCKISLCIQTIFLFSGKRIGLGTSWVIAQAVSSGCSGTSHCTSLSFPPLSVKWGDADSFLWEMAGTPVESQLLDPTVSDRVGASNFIRLFPFSEFQSAFFVTRWHRNWWGDFTIFPDVRPRILSLPT